MIGDWSPEHEGDGNGAGQSLRRWMHCAIVPFWDISTHTQNKYPSKQKGKFKNNFKVWVGGHRKMDMKPYNAYNLLLVLY